MVAMAAVVMPVVMPVLVIMAGMKMVPTMPILA